MLNGESFQPWRPKIGPSSSGFQSIGTPAAAPRRSIRSAAGYEYVLANSNQNCSRFISRRVILEAIPLEQLANRVEQPGSHLGLTIEQRKLELAFGADLREQTFDLSRALAERASQALETLGDRVRQRLAPLAVDPLIAELELRCGEPVLLLGDSQRRILAAERPLFARHPRGFELTLERPEER